MLEDSDFEKKITINWIKILIEQWIKLFLVLHKNSSFVGSYIVKNGTYKTVVLQALIVCYGFILLNSFNLNSKPIFCFKWVCKSVCEEKKQTFFSHKLQKKYCCFKIIIVLHLFVLLRYGLNPIEQKILNKFFFK